jgi:hypothetical protein
MHEWSAMNDERCIGRKNHGGSGAVERRTVGFAQGLHQMHRQSLVPDGRCTGCKLATDGRRLPKRYPRSMRGFTSPTKRSMDSMS